MGILAAYLVRSLPSGAIAHRRQPAQRLIFLTRWCGRRGVVILAPALRLPFSVLEKMLLPFLALMISTVFIATIFTLIAQGLSLPHLISALGITQPDTDELGISAIDFN